jgi:hypothetical protein
MAYLLSLLPALACPLMMGLIMWLMMRGNKDQSGEKANQVLMHPSDDVMNTSQKRSIGGLHICLNWKVVAALAAVGLGIWVVAPNLVWAVVPVLVVLACPLSMLLMMRGTSNSQCATQIEPGHQPREDSLPSCGPGTQRSHVRSPSWKRQGQRPHAIGIWTPAWPASRSRDGIEAPNVAK